MSNLSRKQKVWRRFYYRQKIDFLSIDKKAIDDYINACIETKHKTPKQLAKIWRLRKDG